MPKRVPTPPPCDDEPRYLTVVHPYATSGTCNMELPKDRQDFARWVACCIDKDAFFAIFHKPSSRGMVIIEIKRDYPHFDHILGEHRCSEFLQNPTEEERGRVTQVFHCTYNTGRLVQKNGWKRVDVDEAWFKAWSPRNRYIKFPYPSTHFCDVPVEDRTNHPICRPLPAVKIPLVEVIAAPQPIVGSTEWIQSKETNSPSVPVTKQSKSSPLGAWGKGAPALQAMSTKSNPTANGSGKKVASISQASYTGARLPAVGGGAIAVKASSVWQNTGKKPSVAENWEDSAPVSRESTPALRATSPTTSHQAPPAPPGLNAWASGATPYETYPLGLAVSGKAGSVVLCDTDGAGNVSTMSWGPTGASLSSPDSDSGPDLTTTTESDNPYNVHIHFSESMEEEFHGMRIKPIDDEDDLRGLDSMAPTWDEPVGTASWDTTPAGGWDNDVLDAEDHWKQTQQTTTKPILCNAHGVICKKGICAEYAKQIRLAKRAEEAEKRKEAAANRGKKGGRSKGRSADRKNDEDEDQPVSKSTSQNNPFRGPGAPIKTNWRGTPRAIVSADSIEKREMAKPVSNGGWGNSDYEVEPNVAAVVPDNTAEEASNTSWAISEGAYDPWATAAQPVAKVNPSGGKFQDKKPGQTKSWADQVEAEVTKGGSDFTPITSKRGSRRKGSTTGWSTSATSNAKSSTSGWGTSTSNATKSSTSGWGSVPDMPW